MPASRGRPPGVASDTERVGRSFPVLCLRPAPRRRVLPKDPWGVEDPGEVHGVSGEESFL